LPTGLVLHKLKIEDVGLNRRLAMTTLKDEEIQEIAKKVADANNVPTEAISTTATLDSAGLPAVNVTFSIAPERSSFEIFKDGRSSATVVQVIQLVTDAGEERLPIVHFEVARASGSQPPVRSSGRAD
jgi:hypothetical protein